MTKEVKSKLIEIGAGLVLYLNALFAVKQWNTDSRVELMLYIFAYIVLSDRTADTWNKAKTICFFMF